MQIPCKNGLNETDFDIDDSGKTTTSQNFSSNIDTQFSVRYIFCFHLGEFHRYRFCYLTLPEETNGAAENTFQKFGKLVSLASIKCFRFSFRIVLKKKILKVINYVFKPLTDYWLLA